MDRRSYLLAAGSLSVATLAGCVADDTGEPGSESGDANDGGSDDDDDSDEHEALAVVDAYFAAATDEDFDALAEHMHPYHPFNPDNFDGEEEATVDFPDVENLEREVMTEDFGVDDLREDATVEFWFEETDVTLEEVFEGEEAVLVRTTYDELQDGETVEETEQFVMLTDDGDWKVFFPYEEPPEIPDDEPVADEEYLLVDEVEYDTETEMATVHVSGAGDVEAEELIAYSTSMGQDSSIWSDESETLPDLNYFTVMFDPAGDEIVITVRVDEEEELVIHRDEYEPDE